MRCPTFPHRQAAPWSRTVSLAVLLVLLAGATPLLAQGNFGDPSNLVGVWKMTLEPGTHLVSFPILPPNATVESVIGNQFPGGMEWEEATRILTVDQQAMRGSFFNSFNQSWVGTLHNLDQRKGYWLVIPDDAGPVQLTLIGAALEKDTVNMGQMQPGVNMVGAAYPYPTTLAQSGLVQSGMSSARYIVTSDKVTTWDTGALAPAWHTPSQGWQGAQFALQPGLGYIVVVASGNQGFNWVQPRPQLIPPGQQQPQVFMPMQLQDMTQPIPSFTAPPWKNGTREPQTYPVSGSETPRGKRTKTQSTGGATR